MGKTRRMSDNERLTKRRKMMQDKRADPVFRLEEQRRDRIARNLVRQDPELRSQEQQRNTEAHQRSRQNPGYRSQEQRRNTEAHQRSRQDPGYRSQEQQRDTQVHQLSRQDPEYRSQEQQRNTEAHQRSRQYPEYRSQEQQRDTQAHQLSRQDPEYRSQEQQRDTQAHQLSRQDPGYRSREQQRDTQAHRQTRENTDLRRSERLRDKANRAEARVNPEKRRHDATISSSSKRRVQAKQTSVVYQIEAFKKKCRESPEFVCSCCGGLFYESATHKVSEQILRQNDVKTDEIEQILFVDQTPHRLCDTCYKTANPPKSKRRKQKTRVHKLCLANGLDFPDVPDYVKNLSPLEERLVAPYLPFMQIRLVGAEQQSKLRGNVINVENDLDICATVLPRNMTETSTVQVQLMRRLQYKHPHWHEIIHPYKVRKAMEYLIEQEAYKEKEITLSDLWNESRADEVLNFACGETEEETTREEPESESDSDDENEDTLGRVHPVETLVLDSESATLGYRIAPGEKQRPVPFLQDLHMEEITFPAIFGGQKRALKDGVKLTNTDMFKSKVRNRNRICVRNPTYLLYLFKKSFNQKVRDALQIVMRKQKGGSNFTAGDIRCPGFLDRQIQIDNGYVAFQNVRSTPAYWKRQQKKVVSMIRQQGKCAFFITFSAAETKWPDLLVSLAKIVWNRTMTEEEVKQLPYDQVCELIRSDPVTCMRHFDHKFRAFKNCMIQPNPPKEGVFSPYEVTDYFCRLEFQMRGSPHIHGLFWIKDAPVFIDDDDESENKVIEFIDSFVTSEKDDSEEMKSFVDYQNHKHTHTCRKWAGKQRKCRFRFPQPPLPKTMILKPLPPGMFPEEIQKFEDDYMKIVKDLDEKTRSFQEDIDWNSYVETLGLTPDEYINAIRSSISRPTVFLRRKTNAAFINGYNKQILKTWGANMDIQYVLDTYACAKYCVNYISKAEGGVSKLLKACMRDIRRGNFSVKERLTAFGDKLINASEFSTQEAAAFVIGLPNTFCSRQDTYINTSRPEERISFLRPENELRELEDTSDDIYAKGLLDYYSKRPKDFENVCLAEIASNYNITKRTKTRQQADGDEDSEESDQENAEDSQASQLLDDDAGEDEEEDSPVTLKERKVRKIIRFRHYSRIRDEDEYWREQLMLFVPWRNEEAELLDVNAREKALSKMDEILANSKYYYHDRKIDEDDIHTDMNNAEFDFDDSEDAVNREDQVLIEEEATEYTRQYLTEQPSAPDMQRFLPPKFIPDKEYDDLMYALNNKQRKFTLHCLHLFKTSDDPFYYVLHGGAGVGKSKTIMAIVQCFLRHHQSFPSSTPDCPPVLVTSFTGKAAFNVFGMTLSSAFRLQPLQNKQSQGNLDDGAANSLRAKLRDLKLLIIDEISMVGVRMLYDVDKRLKQVKCNTKPFGGVSVIVVGHFRQLKPICDSWVFATPTHLKGGELGSLWDAFTIFELDEIMRQKGDAKCCKGLNNMSEGVMDAEDIALFKSRVINERLQPPRDAIWLFRTNAECQEYNAKIHAELSTDGFEAIAQDRIEGADGNTLTVRRMKEYAKTLDVNKCDGLRYSVPLKVGAIYLISTNIDVSDGLFNGADGMLMKIDYGLTGDNTRLPIRVWIKFKENLVGCSKRSFTKDLQVSRGIPLEWVPIERLTRHLSKANYQNGKLIRSQFPLLPANAMTIAKSQGSTLSAVVVGMSEGRPIERDQLYVACSRATSIKTLYIKGTFKPPRKPAPNDLVTKELARLRNKPLQFSFPFLQDIPPSEKKVYFHNIQSFGSHGKHLLKDECPLAADLIALVEPKLRDGEVSDCSPFKVLHQSSAQRRGNSFNSEGGLLLSKPNECVYLETTVTPEGRTHSDPHCTIMICKLFEVNVVVMYKHPNLAHGDFLRVLQTTLRKFSHEPTIVVGDINVNMRDPAGKGVSDMFKKFNLTPKLSPNAASTNFGTTIDICFSNIDVNAWYYETYYSHHKAICVTWKRH